MQFIEVSLARHVSGAYAHHQERYMLKVAAYGFLHPVSRWVVVLRAAA